jgi:hypothetical protein
VVCSEFQLALYEHEETHTWHRAVILDRQVYFV